MLEGEGIQPSIIKTTTRNLVAEWIIGAYNKIGKEAGCNAWRKKGFEWRVNSLLF